MLKSRSPQSNPVGQSRTRSEGTEPFLEKTGLGLVPGEGPEPLPQFRMR